MEALEKLREATCNVIEVAQNIHDNVNKEIWDKGPVIVHQSFCSKLVEIMKRQDGLKMLAEVPEAMDVMTAIRVLEDLFPSLKK